MYLGLNVINFKAVIDDPKTKICYWLCNCNIFFLFLLFFLLEDKSFPYKTKHEQRRRVALSERFTEADLRGLPELNPPALMQHGNVGTPLKVFLQLIQSCRLPPRLIRKLGLTFPKTSSNRRYGNVPFHYNNTCTLPATEETVLTAAGHEITGPGAWSAPSSRWSQATEHVQATDDEENQEEEERQSDADDVSRGHRRQRLFMLNIHLSVPVGGFLMAPVCRMRTTVRSGSATRLCTRMSPARSEAKKDCLRKRLSWSGRKEAQAWYSTLMLSTGRRRKEVPHKNSKLALKSFSNSLIH